MRNSRGVQCYLRSTIELPWLSDIRANARVDVLNEGFDKLEGKGGLPHRRPLGQYQAVMLLQRCSGTHL